MSPRRRQSLGDQDRSLLARIGLSPWMPVVGLLAPAGYALYRAFSADDAVSGFLSAVLWPGIALYVIGVGILWLGWNANLDQ